MKLKSDNISVSTVEYGSVYLWPLVLDTCIKVLIFVGGLKITVVSTQSARQYEDKFRQHYDNFVVANLRGPNRAGQDCYDATWILALALNNTLTGMVLNSVIEVYLHAVQYGTPYIVIA